MATKTLLILLSSLLFSLTSTIATSSTPRINVWPKPVNISWPNPKATTLSSSFQILTSCNHVYLRVAIRRYARFVLSERYDFIRPPLVNSSSSMPQLKALQVSVTDLRAPLQYGVDESYVLWISSAGEANLTATTVWGAMHGLETFSQLVWGKKLMVPVDIYIGDKPIFGHRGFMLDTARNYYPVKDILRTIRAMAANKMNVFHWHISDSQSFPMMLPSEPELAKKGAYGTKMVYTREDVRRIVEYGMRHGVRIVPEFDGPAHAGSWAKTYPDIVTCADMFWMPPGDSLAAEPGTGQLNPLNPKTYQVVKNVVRDAADVFPDSFYHAGADEVIASCWKTDTTIQFFLNNGGSLGELLEIYIDSTYPFILSLNRTVVYWEDVLLDAAINVSAALLPPETTILQTWNNGPNNTKRIVSAGYRAIVSSADFYYLDCGHGSFIGNDSRYDKQVSDDPGMPFNYNGGNGGSWCGPYKTWQRVYDYDITHGLTVEEAKLVIGGEVALWSEQADETVLDGLVWPRASAMAEALWSGNRDATGKKRYAEATDRLNEWRYRMVARGIAAAPIQPLWCLQNPGMCDLVQ